MAALEVRIARLLCSSCLIILLSGFRKYPEGGRWWKTAVCFKNEQVDRDCHEIARGACAPDFQCRQSLMLGVLG